jgi:hypothetical protein
MPERRPTVSFSLVVSSSWFVLPWEHNEVIDFIPQIHAIDESIRSTGDVWMRSTGDGVHKPLVRPMDLSNQSTLKVG